jgi:hypothetical protein
MIDKFFRPFFGGVFLEKDLRTSARMLLFLFAMFDRGWQCAACARHAGDS